ncbi:hypothetical protein E0H26_11745 [Micromonospora zingiberis]|uniref:Uncharacterized protein n=1 Tax=Micromonospora zingiberis TaxID=2053011 RepID=A0A4R0GPT9_9ACTN|nr:hypothetical protein [Micromonospora zingiberis]TCB97719.1 hypothetical protein E0H26_11745 [Micromonospora zingiberis]
MLDHWDLIEADLHSEYGVDLDEPGILQQRTWRWLSTRIAGLLSADTRLARALSPEPEVPEGWRR